MLRSSLISLLTDFVCKPYKQKPLSSVIKRAERLVMYEFELCLVNNFPDGRGGIKVGLCRTELSPSLVELFPDGLGK